MFGFPNSALPSDLGIFFYFFFSITPVCMCIGTHTLRQAPLDFITSVKNYAPCVSPCYPGCHESSPLIFFFLIQSVAFFFFFFSHWGDVPLTSFPLTPSSPFSFARSVTLLFSPLSALSSLSAFFNALDFPSFPPPDCICSLVSLVFSVPIFAGQIRHYLILLFSITRLGRTIPPPTPVN